MTKTAQGAWLAAVGLLVALIDGAAYAYNRAQWDNDEGGRLARDVFAGGDGSSIGSFDTTIYVIAAVIAALLVVCGVILFAADNASPGSGD